MDRKQVASLTGLAPMTRLNLRDSVRAELRHRGFRELKFDKPFVALGEYAAPTLPTEDRVRLAIRSLTNEVFNRGNVEAPTIADERLEGITAEQLDAIAAPPALGNLLAEMDTTFGTWLKDADAPLCVQTVILPPCDENNLVRTWSERHGLTCLNAPERTVFLSATDPFIPDISGNGILIIPNLEEWFVRHRNGLKTIRGLLAEVSKTKRRVLIGCNSWAWTYLSSVIGVDLQFPDAVTFQPFDRYRLEDWFSELSELPDAPATTFRLSASGKDVFATDDEGALQSDFFQKLAAHSLGIPWVAWSLWRRSFRKTRETEEDDDANENPFVEKNDSDTVWVAALEDFTLPKDQRQSALLILQSLLIHGPMSFDHLQLTLPFVGQTNVVEALVRAGIFQLDAGRITCVAAAYPTVRRELGNAGFSMDKL